MFKKRFVLLPVVVATLLFQLAMPVIARADDGTLPLPTSAATATPAASPTP